MTMKKNLLVTILMTSAFSFGNVYADYDIYKNACGFIQACQMEEKRKCDETQTHCNVSRDYIIEGRIYNIDEFREIVHQDKELLERLERQEVPGNRGTASVKESGDTAGDNLDRNIDAENSRVNDMINPTNTENVSESISGEKQPEENANNSSVTKSGFSSGDKIETLLENLQNAKDLDSGEAQYKGSSNFKLCQEAFSANDKNIKEVALNPTENSELFVNVSLTLVKKYLRDNSAMDQITRSESYVKVYEELGKNPTEKMSQGMIKEAIAKSLKKAITKTRVCILFAKTIKENFDPENKRYKDKDYTDPEVVKSFDQRLKCKSTGLETIDYDDCRAMVYAYNGAKLTIEGNNALQVFQGQEAGMKANEKLMNMDANEDVSTTALEVQSEGLDTQKNMAETRGALHTAKVTAMTGFAMKLPSHEEVMNLCTADGQMKEVMDIIVSGKFDSVRPVVLDKVADYTKEEHCRIAFENSDNHILLNQGQKTTALAIAAEAGVDAAKEFMAADILADQKSLVDGTINKIKGMETIDLPEDAFQSPEMMTFCKANPNAQECVGFGQGMTTHVTGGGLSFSGGFGANETLNPTVNNDDSVAAIADSDAATRTSADIPTSTAIGSIDKGSGFADATPGKAKVSSSQVGGGGGAGGGSPGSAGGLSGSGPSTGAKGAAPASSGRKYKLGYSGGSRPLSFRGGSSRSKGSSKGSVANPFAKMLGKKKAGNDVFNFRGLASKGVGGKDGNLFERISKSYDAMNKKNRLMKYKLSE